MDPVDSAGVLGSSATTTKRHQHEEHDRPADRDVGDVERRPAEAPDPEIDIVEHGRARRAFDQVRQAPANEEGESELHQRRVRVPEQSEDEDHRHGAERQDEWAGLPEQPERRAAVRRWMESEDIPENRHGSPDV